MVRSRYPSNFFEVKMLSSDDKITPDKSYAFIQRFQSWNSNVLDELNSNEDVCAENIDLLLSELAAYRDAQDGFMRMQQDSHFNVISSQIIEEAKWKQIIEEKNNEIAILKEQIAKLQLNEQNTLTNTK